MNIVKKFFAWMLVLSMFVFFPVTAKAAEVETVDDGDYIVLDTFQIPLSVTIYNEGENGMRSASVDVEIGADVVIQQLTGTNKIRTVIEVQSADYWSGVQIKSFSATINYTNYTDFSIPDCQDSLSKSTSSPSNYLIGTKDSSASFVTGHTIAVTVTITDVQIANADSFSFTPGSSTTRVTIQ